MTHTSTRDELVTRLVRAGELEISGESQEEADSYFDTENFAFHGPDGFDSDYAGLTEYFRSIRAAFEDRAIRRGIIIAEGDLIACQTWIEGTFGSFCDLACRAALIKRIVVRKSREAVSLYPASHYRRRSMGQWTLRLPRCRARWLLRSRASSPTPSMKVDLRRRRNLVPMTYRPGMSVTPPWWRIWPLGSSTGRCSQL